MHRFLNEFSKCRVIIYFDNTLILGRKFEEYVHLVNQVLCVLQEHDLKIKLIKCSWLQAEVKFFCHLAEHKVLLKLPDYIRMVEEFPTPTIVKELDFLVPHQFEKEIHPYVLYCL